MKRDHMLGGPQAFDRLSEEMDYIRRIAVDANDKRLRINAANNLEKVRRYYEDHPGCTQVQISRVLNLSRMQVYSAVQKLRNTWKDT